MFAHLTAESVSLLYNIPLCKYHRIFFYEFHSSSSYEDLIGAVSLTNGILRTYFSIGTYLSCGINFKWLLIFYHMVKNIILLDHTHLLTIWIVYYFLCCDKHCNLHSSGSRNSPFSLFANNIWINLKIMNKWTPTGCIITQFTQWMYSSSQNAKNIIPTSN